MSRRLGEILVDAKVLPERSVAEALDRQRGADKRLGTVLVEMGLVDEQTVVAALSEQFDLPVADLRHYEPDADAVARVPEKMARSLSAAPLRLTPLGLEVAVADPLDATARTRLEEVAGAPVLLRLATADDIQRAVDRCYPTSQRHRRPARPVARSVTRSEVPLPPPVSLAGDGLESLLAQATRVEASEIHIERLVDDIRVLLRVAGILHPVDISASTALALLQRATLSAGTLYSKVDGRLVRVGLSTVATPHGERARLRLSYRDEDRPASLASLGMPPAVLGPFRQQLAKPGGLVLVSGPRRSGRSTTLDAATAEAVAQGRSVLALGDERPSPLPFVLQVPATMPAVWDAIERQDPDVLIIDELGDEPTAPRATRLAIGGVLVVAAVVAVDPAGAISRLLALGVDRFLLAATLKAVLLQHIDHRPASPANGSDAAPARTAVATFELLEVDDVVRHAVRSGLAG